MTVAEAAARLGVHVSLVYRLCRAGKLPHRRIGLGRGAIRITEVDLAEFLEAARVGIKAEEPESAQAPEKQDRRTQSGWKIKYL